MHTSDTTTRPSPHAHACATRGCSEAHLPEELEESLRALIARTDFPCVGAKAALAQSGLRIETAGDITSPADDRRIQRALARWSRVPATDEADFRSLTVIFHGPRDLDEKGFERALWDRLSGISEADAERGFATDPGFSSNPGDPDFALSFGGRAYFAVGLHPKASRRARRLPFPAIVFNLHNQFAKLRAEDRYERMREVILARDEAFDGEPNPMLARHGEVSEARQYSGREVEEDWSCPFFRPGKSA
ncbi:MAG: YqcI/YcgG family protein [Erythrobacter sp.]|uniref:guanitoxin biosynthesis heme-dependent pre-guanitoxin N-hydroxylase GntA n=1 Tax=Erythrobacter sp. TaxID=1042 RepID=UPI0025F029AA|nr:guanitoxin biosynthesis heme-dependent pre-guanitoxin N-hydroxylase GntA [Erythrobacter sp.]MCL9999760.1 YqcI/YcgG family protein [Erythrobacter sp.]